MPWRATLRALTWLSALVALTAGCVTTREPTEVVIEVRADGQVRELMQKLRLVVSSARGDLGCSDQDCWVTRLQTSFTKDQLDWPLHFPILPLGGNDTRVFEVIAQALDRGGNVLVEQRAVSGFAAGNSARITLALEDLCIKLAGTCAANADCHGPLCGVCTAGECNPTGIWTADTTGQLARSEFDAGPQTPEAGPEQDGETAQQDGEAQAEQDGEAQAEQDGKTAEQDGGTQADGGMDAGFDADQADAACVPKSCAELGAACGENVPDGCGGTLVSCGAGNCGANGPRYACAADHSGCECVPRSSSEVCQGKLCGSYDDGCGTLIPCGTCGGSRSCQASGEMASCRCDSSAAANAAACGTAACGNVTTSDGCVYVCGLGLPCATTCSAGGACGAGHDCACPLGGPGADDDEICSAGRCCNPKSAAEACGTQDCGSASDGCGGSVSCGSNNGACPAGSGCADPTYNLDSAVPRCILQDHANLLGKYLVRAHSFRQAGGTAPTFTKGEAVSLVTIQRMGGALRMRERGCVASERGIVSGAVSGSAASLATSFFKVPELVVDVVAGAGSAAGPGSWERPYNTVPLGFINARPSSYFCDSAGSASPTDTEAPEFDAVAFDQAAVATPASGAHKPWLAAPGVCSCPSAAGYASLPPRNIGAPSSATDCRINDIDGDSKPGFSVVATAPGATVATSHASLSTIKWWGKVASSGSHYGYSAISDDRATRPATQWLSCQQTQGVPIVCSTLANTTDWGCGYSFNLLRFTKLKGNDLQLSCESFYPTIPVTSVTGVNQNAINARFGPIEGSACTVGSNEGCREDEICRAGAGSQPTACVPMTTPGACTGTGTSCRAGWTCTVDSSCWPASCPSP